jgi:hypothetical protein
MRFACYENRSSVLRSFENPLSPSIVSSSQPRLNNEAPFGLSQEVLTGCVTSILFSCWLTFGTLVTGVRHPQLPVSVDSCPVEAIANNITIAVLDAMQATPQTQTVEGSGTFRYRRDRVEQSLLSLDNDDGLVL